MAPVDSKIDELYKGPLKEFVARRAALAKSLTGDEARRVKGLQKPTVVPWTVNQVYWHARPVYDRLISSGEKLRAAQIDALKGRSADVRRATDAHRRALPDAVREALRLASGAGAHPAADDLTKTLEAVSLARDLPEQAGRLTQILRPAGFEALAGVPVKAPHRPAPTTPVKALHRAAPTAVARPTPAPSPAKTQSNRRQGEAEDRRRKKAIERATMVAARAKAAETRARGAWERTRQALANAELALASLK